MKTGKKCKKCKTEMYQDSRDKWFCPDCILQEIDPDFLDEKLDHPGTLRRPYILEPVTTQISLRLPASDLKLARKLARRKGISRYQTYISSLLHHTLAKEAAEKR
jgi:predicted DNA binding CopG/RHH family protein